MTNNKQRDIWIDTLRGIAALGVMIAHLAVTFPNIGVKGSGTGKQRESYHFMVKKLGL